MFPFSNQFSDHQVVLIPESRISLLVPLVSPTPAQSHGQAALVWRQRSALSRHLVQEDWRDKRRLQSGIGRESSPAPEGFAGSRISPSFPPALNTRIGAKRLAKSAPQGCQTGTKADLSQLLG